MYKSLDARLRKDSYILGNINGNALLLIRNALFPWFVLVPDTTETELHRLDADTQLAVLQQINLVSSFIEQHFTVHKLNIAAIGNIVSQLHIHIVGRRREDACWPGVVWGTDKFADYRANEVEEIKDNLAETLGNKFCKYS